jgi:hypothetical protein
MPNSYRPKIARGQQRDKLYREALHLELAAAGENLKKLREIAKVHIARCAAGDMQAIRELADRLDGKPATNIESIAYDDGGDVKRIVWEIVHVTEPIDAAPPLMVEYQETINSTGNNQGNGHS